MGGIRAGRRDSRSGGRGTRRRLDSETGSDRPGLGRRPEAAGERPCGPVAGDSDRPPARPPNGPQTSRLRAGSDYRRGYWGATRARPRGSRPGKPEPRTGPADLPQLRLAPVSGRWLGPVGAGTEAGGGLGYRRGLGLAARRRGCAAAAVGPAAGTSPPGSSPRPVPPLPRAGAGRRRRAPRDVAHRGCGPCWQPRRLPAGQLACGVSLLTVTVGLQSDSGLSGGLVVRRPGPARGTLLVTVSDLQAPGRPEPGPPGPGVLSGSGPGPGSSRAACHAVHSPRASQ